MRNHFRYGIQLPAKFQVASTYAVEPGDLCYLIGGVGTNTVYPVSAFVWLTDLAESQARVRSYFAGVAMSAVDGDATDRNVTLDTSPFSVWRMELATATSIEQGDPLGPAELLSSFYANKLAGPVGLGRSLALAHEAGENLTGVNVSFLPVMWFPDRQVQGIARNDIAALTDNSGGTASSTLASITAGAAYAQADMTAVKNAIASLAYRMNKLTAQARSRGWQE